MDLTAILARLRSHEADLRASGILALSVFGSVARGEARPDSDVDLAAALDDDARLDLVGFDRLEKKLAAILRLPADLVAEPTPLNPRLQAEIDRDGIVAF